MDSVIQHCQCLTDDNEVPKQQSHAVRVPSRVSEHMVGQKMDYTRLQETIGMKNVASKITQFHSG